MRTIRLTRRRLRGGALATIGYILSPLSWWNDLLVNVPLAYAFATIIGLIARQWFVPALVVGYWLTNILGFVLLHIGGVEALTRESDGPRPYGRRDIIVDIVMSIGYTILVLLLVYFGWLTFPEEILP
ncbi:hypothetical protein [Haloarchaeobius sp. DFWS5]|uniref:hypothetical protein n=1 Tax=Haloarchaeobius sp. DFWS5 TaxID=3446114 RepID=UPI003EB9020C